MISLPQLPGLAAATDFLSARDSLYEMLQKISQRALQDDQVPRVSVIREILALAGPSEKFTVEVPSGTLDGVNRTFALEHLPTTRLILLFVGKEQLVEGVDFQRVGQILTVSLRVAYLATSSMLAVYEYVPGTDEAPPGPPPTLPPVGTAGTWTQATCPAKAWRRVAYSPDLDMFAAISPDSGDGVAISTDGGETWTAQALDAGYGLGDICWGDGQWLITEAGTANKSWTSSNGTSWTKNSITGPTYYPYMTRVIWAEGLGKYVASLTNGGGGPGPYAFTSWNGVAWYEHTAPNIGGSGLCWSPELEIVVHTSNINIFTSTSGEYWSQWPVQVGTSDFRAVEWSSDLGLFVLAYAEFQTSSDGKHWTVQPDSNGGTYGSEALVWSHARQLWVAVGSTIRTSPDGKTWGLETNPAHMDLTDIACDDVHDRLVAVAQSTNPGFPNQIIYSDN